MVVPMLVAVVGVNRTLLRRLLRGFDSLDVSCTAATTFFLSQGLLLCWRQNLRAELSEKLIATDASTSGTGSCFAAVGLACLVRVSRGKRCARVPCLERRRTTEQGGSGTCGFARGLGTRLKRTIEVTKDQFLVARTGFGCLAHDIALELVWVPTWANLADALSRGASRSRVGMPHRQSFLL